MNDVHLMILARPNDRYIVIIQTEDGLPNTATSEITPAMTWSLVGQYASSMDPTDRLIITRTEVD
jgi:PIN domain nuclease of toxin-antitoxin system